MSETVSHNMARIHRYLDEIEATAQVAIDDPTQPLNAPWLVSVVREVRATLLGETDDEDRPFPADAIYAALHHPEVFGCEASEGNIGRSVIVAAFRRALREQGFVVSAADDWDAKRKGEG